MAKRRPRAPGLFDEAAKCPRTTRGRYAPGAGYRGKLARSKRSGRFLPGAGCTNRR